MEDINDMDQYTVIGGSNYHITINIYPNRVIGERFSVEGIRQNNWTGNNNNNNNSSRSEEIRYSSIFEVGQADDNVNMETEDAEVIFIGEVKASEAGMIRDHSTSNMSLGKIIKKYKGKIHLESSTFEGFDLNENEKQVCIKIRSTTKELRLKMCGEGDRYYGTGLFSKQLIKKDDIIIEYGGPRINVKDLGMTEKEFVDSRKDNEYLMKIGKGYFIDGSDVTKAGCGRFINHSCKPNAIYDRLYLSSDKIPTKMMIVVRAIRDILPEEQIQTDYGMSESNIECKCGSDECSGKVGVSYDMQKSMERKLLKRKARKDVQKVIFSN